MDQEYAAFLERVKRTIYVDNLSPQVSESVMRAAFDQFGNVTKFQFIPLYMQPSGSPLSALVEMANSNQAEKIIVEMNSCPFMIGGMPRPVRVKAAVAEMFDDRPRMPGRTIQCRWMDPSEPEFEVARKIRKLVRMHVAEASYLLQEQYEEEDKLADEHNRIIRTHYNKLELIEGLLDDGTAQKLTKHYQMDL